MDMIYSNVNQKTRFAALSLKKNKKNVKETNTHPSPDVITIDDSFDRIRSEFAKSRLEPEKIYSPIVLEQSDELSQGEFLSIDKFPSKTGNVSGRLSSSPRASNSKPSYNGWSPSQDFFCATSRTVPEPSTPADILNESQEHCTMEKITKSHHKLLSELYGEDIWKNFRAPNGVSKKLLYDDEDKENIRSVIKKNKELYLTDSERKKKNDIENAEKKSKKKLYTEIVSTPEVPKAKLNIPTDAKSTLKKYSKAMTVTEMVKNMENILEDKGSWNNMSGNNVIRGAHLTPGTNGVDKKVLEKGSTKKIQVGSSVKNTKGTDAQNDHVKDDKKNQGINYISKQLKQMDICRTPDTKRLSFVASLADNTPSWRCHPEALQYHDKYKTLREELVRRLYAEFNREVFGDKLDKDMPLIWDTKLRSTAGTTTNRLLKRSSGERVRVSSIKLSSKVLDSAQRARDTLIHEMCHAATWLLDGDLRAGHGPLWLKWCRVALRAFPELEQISRCHELEIHYKYSYKCQQCGYSIKRHSKSIDVTKKCCGYCRGTFEVIVNKKTKDGVLVSTPARKGGANEFALFVKEHYGSLKKAGHAHPQVMKLLGEQFSAHKKAKLDS